MDRTSKHIRDMMTTKAAMIISIIEEHNLRHWHEVAAEFNATGFPFNEKDRQLTEHYLDYVTNATVNGKAAEWKRDI